MTSFKHIETLIKKHPEIEVFRFFCFSFSNKVQDRVGPLSLDEKNLIECSIEYKKNNSTSFWEAFFTTCVKENKTTPRILSEAIHHNKNNKYIYVLSKDVLDFLNCNQYENLAINSEVILDSGEKKHIPMLDFKIKSEGLNIALVHSVIESLSLKGFILNSGKSYHFIGDNLICKEQLTELLAKFVLFHPISDKAWAAHQLIEGSASLRVSKKYNLNPTFIKNVT